LSSDPAWQDSYLNASLKKQLEMWVKEDSEEF
jgi:hypothetical protein